MKDNGVHARDTGDERVDARDMHDERVDARDMRDERVYARGMDDNRVHARGGRMQMPRSRGAASGFLLVLLGAWGALIPFVGPYFDWAFTPDQEWVWTTGRGWLEVLPGAVTALGGLLLLSSRNRFTAMLGGWLSVLAGAWFVVGRALAGLLAIGDAGTPVAATDAKRVALDLTYFYGLGALIIFLGAIALGRLSIRSARDIRYAHRTAMNSMATTAEPPASDDVTEIQPAQTTPEPRHRPWGNVFGRGSRLAHR
jgi:hypothetical protein